MLTHCFLSAGKETRHKWRILQTCLRRELKKQKIKNEEKLHINADNTYILISNSNVLPTMQDRRTVSECSPTQEFNTKWRWILLYSDSIDKSQSDNHSQRTRAASSTQAKNPEIPVRNRQTKKKSAVYEESLLNILKWKKE